METEKIVIDWTDGFNGLLQAPGGEIEISETALKPYNLLYGALGSCFYATFLEIARKKRLHFDHGRVTITGTKRDEVPATLNYVKVVLTVSNPSNEVQIIKSAELGAKYCSIYTTISKVAAIDLVVEFE
ncbi:MAG: OsmC family protein [Bacilli bacterium]|nr:OsmC family protein [Bacilli bacterium]